MQELEKAYFAASRLQGAETCCLFRSSGDDLSVILAGTSRPVLLKNYEHATFSEMQQQRTSRTDKIYRLFMN